MRAHPSATSCLPALMWWTHRPWSTGSMALGCRDCSANGTAGLSSSATSGEAHPRTATNAGAADDRSRSSSRSRSGPAGSCGIRARPAV